VFVEFFELKRFGATSSEGFLVVTVDVVLLLLR